MARVKNVMKAIKTSRGLIDDKYDMCQEHINDIHEASKDCFDLICNGFCFGYLQGMKAARAEARQKKFGNITAEYRETIAAGLRRIRCSYSLKIINQLVELRLNMDNGIDSGRSCCKWMLIRDILDYQLSEKDLGSIYTFCKVFSEKRMKQLQDSAAVVINPNNEKGGQQYA